MVYSVLFLLKQRSALMAKLYFYSAGIKGVKVIFVTSEMGTLQKQNSRVIPFWQNSVVTTTKKNETVSSYTK